jgi:hypothetical protein
MMSIASASAPVDSNCIFPALSFWRRAIIIHVPFVCLYYLYENVPNICVFHEYKTL